MPFHPGTRTKRGMRRRLPRIGMLAGLGLLTSAASAQAWSQPSAVFTGAARTVFSVAGDNSGNAFAVLAGESSDLPIVLVRVDEIEETALVRELLRPHEYWQMKGLAVDLVVLNERSAGLAYRT